MADLDIGKLIASLGLDPREFNQAMRQVEQQMNKANKIMEHSTRRWQDQFRDVGRQMQTMGKQMTMFITLPMIGAGVAAFKMQKDFEKSMSMIEGLVGVAREQVQAWRKDVLSMADALGKSPKELADALYFVTSAGVKGAEAMQVLEMSAKASVAGLGETKIVADAVTSAINAYGKENISAAEATDVLVAAVREGKAEATGFAGSIGQVIPVASAMGVTFGEIAGVIAGMTRTGTGVETAAMQLKNILATILKGGTKESEKLLEGLGSSFEELRRKVKEEGVLSALLELNRLTSLNADTMSLLFPNIRALKGVLDLLGSNLEENKIIIDKVVNSTGALDHAFRTAADTSEFTYQQAINSVKIALIEFGTALKDTILPIMQGFIKRVREMTKWFKDLDDQQKKNVIRVVAMVAALGPLLVVMGKLMTLIATNPYIALAGAIALIVVGLSRWATAGKKILDFQTQLAQINTQVNTEYAKQAAEIKKLVWMIENENLSNEQRVGYIEELKKLMPEYNGSLTKEGELINHNKIAIDDYIVSLKEKIRLHVYEEQYTELLRKQMEAENNLTEAQRKQAEASYRVSTANQSSLIPKGMGGIGTFVPSVVKDLESALESANEDVVKASNAVDTYSKLLSELEQQMKKTSATASATKGGTGGGGGGGTGEGKVDPAVLSWALAYMRYYENSKKFMVGNFQAMEGLGESVNEEIQYMLNLWDEAPAKIEKYVQGLEFASQVVGSLESAFTSFFSNIGKGFDQMLAGFVNMLNQMAAQMAARAVMFLLLDLISGGTGSIAKLAGSLLGGKNLKQWMGMAQGGVIPPGYPNDTFPALLSSGETVTPAGESPMKNIHITVDGKISGKDIALALRRM